MRIAVVGSGVSGLTSAYLLAPTHDVTLFESADRLGGHARTVSVRDQGRDLPVDTGFMVYNERNYPILSTLFRELDVPTRESDMSFSLVDDTRDVYWCGSSLNALFAQRRNLVRGDFWRMLRDVARFNRAARELATDGGNEDLTLRQFLARGRWSESFASWYLVPMGSAIWSIDPQEFLDFPAIACARFFDNHGLLELTDRPQWRTVVGGSKRYVDAVAKPLAGRVHLNAAVTKVVRRRRGVEVATQTGAIDTFDHVIIATHADEALRSLADPREVERDVLGALPYRSNLATVHRDESLLPRSSRARASWNWRRGAGEVGPTLTYDLARLQGHDVGEPLLLTLNRPAVRPARVIETTTFRHPVFTAAGLRAQRRHGDVNGHGDISFVGAYWGMGFHEDGARSALRVARALGVAWREGEL